MKNLLILGAIAFAVYYFLNMNSGTCATTQEAEAKRADLYALTKPIVAEKDMERVFNLSTLQAERTAIDNKFKVYYSGKQTDINFQALCDSISLHSDKL